MKWLLPRIPPACTGRPGRPSGLCQYCGAQTWLRQPQWSLVRQDFGRDGARRWDLHARRARRAYVRSGADVEWDGPAPNLHFYFLPKRHRGAEVSALRASPLELFRAKLAKVCRPAPRLRSSSRAPPGELLPSGQNWQRVGGHVLPLWPLLMGPLMCLFDPFLKQQFNSISI